MSTSLTDSATTSMTAATTADMESLMDVQTGTEHSSGTSTSTPATAATLVDQTPTQNVQSSHTDTSGDGESAAIPGRQKDEEGDEFDFLDDIYDTNIREPPSTVTGSLSLSSSRPQSTVTGSRITNTSSTQHSSSIVGPSPQVGEELTSNTQNPQDDTVLMSVSYHTNATATAAISVPTAGGIDSISSAQTLGNGSAGVIAQEGNYRQPMDRTISFIGEETFKPIREHLWRISPKEGDFPIHGILEDPYQHWIPVGMYPHRQPKRRICEVVTFIRPLYRLLNLSSAKDVQTLYSDVSSIIRLKYDHFCRLYRLLGESAGLDRRNTTPRDLELPERAWKRIRRFLQLQPKESAEDHPKMDELVKMTYSSVEAENDEHVFSEKDEINCAAFYDIVDEGSHDFWATRERTLLDSSAEIFRAVTGTFVPREDVGSLRFIASGEDIRPKLGTIRGIVALLVQSEHPLAFCCLILKLLPITHASMRDNHVEERKVVVSRIRGFYIDILPQLLQIWENNGMASISPRILTNIFYHNTASESNQTGCLPLVKRRETVNIPDESTEQAPHLRQNIESLVQQSFQMGWLSLKRSLVKPAYVLPNEHYNFSLPDEWIRHSSRVVLFCMKAGGVPGDSVVKHYWSPYLAYYVNSSFLNVPSGCKAPIDISSLVSPGKNDVTICANTQVPEGLLIAVYEADKADVTGVYRSIIWDRLISTAEALESLKSGFGRSDKCPTLEFADYHSVKMALSGTTPRGKRQKFDDEIETDSFSVSVHDPLSLAPISLPVRGIRCDHLRPFDLSSFLKLNSGSSPKWTCPICQMPLPFGELHLDTFVYSVLHSICNGWHAGTLQCIEDGYAEILKRRENSEDVNIQWPCSKIDPDWIRSIEILSNGNWRVALTSSQASCENPAKGVNPGNGKILKDNVTRGANNVIEILSDDDSE